MLGAGLMGQGACRAWGLVLWDRGMSHLGRPHGAGAGHAWAGLVGVGQGGEVKVGKGEKERKRKEEKEKKRKGRKRKRRERGTEKGKEGHEGCEYGEYGSETRHGVVWHDRMIGVFSGRRYGR